MSLQTFVISDLAHLNLDALGATQHPITMVCFGVS